MPTQTTDAPYIATHRPEPPPPPSAMKARHYHLAYDAGERGKCITQARWAAPEDASMWAAAFRVASRAGDGVAIDGNHYLTRFGVDPAIWPGASGARAKADAPARDPAAGSLVATYRPDGVGGVALYNWIMNNQTAIQLVSAGRRRPGHSGCVCLLGWRHQQRHRRSVPPFRRSRPPFRNALGSDKGPGRWPPMAASRPTTTSSMPTTSAVVFTLSPRQK